MNNHDDGRFFLTLPRNAQEQQSLGGSDLEKRRCTDRAKGGIYTFPRATTWIVLGGVAAFALAMWGFGVFA